MGSPSAWLFLFAVAFTILLIEFPPYPRRKPDAGSDGPPINQHPCGRTWTSGGVRYWENPSDPSDPFTEPPCRPDCECGIQSASRSIAKEAPR
jgi:hypothetical protein